MNIQTRQTLIERIQKEKSDDSWEEFYQIYSRYLYVVIRNMNVSTSDAEDILQESLLKAWKGLPKFHYDPDKHRFRSWLLTVVRNTLRSYITKKANKVSQLLQQEQDELKYYLNKISIPDEEGYAESEWRKYIVDMALENIKDSFQGSTFEVFQDYLQGLTTEEIAVKHKVPENTARVYKKRVKEKLQREVSRLDYELG